MAHVSTLARLECSKTALSARIVYPLVTNVVASPLASAALITTSLILHVSMLLNVQLVLLPI